MRILIVGRGVVAYTLAEELSKEGQDISIVAEDQALINKISEKLDVFPVLGHESSPKVLEAGGIREADMVIAVTDTDEHNMVICMLAEKYGVKHKIARIRNPEYAKKDAVLRPYDLHIDRIINPEKVTVDAIENLIATPGASDVADFLAGDIILRGFKITGEMPICGLHLSELKKPEDEEHFLIIALTRDEKTIIPSGNDRIQQGDKIYAVMLKEALPGFLPLVGQTPSKTRKVIVFGGTFFGVGAAAMLENSIDSVTLIEVDKATAEEASSRLNKTLVLQGRGTDGDLLQEANIDAADFFMALSDDSENNLMAALLAKKHGAKKTLVLTLDPEYMPLLEKQLEVDFVINPRVLTVGAILQFVRKGKVLSIAKIGEKDAEAIELVASPGSKIIGKPLLDVKMPRGAIIGAVVSDGAAYIPNGRSVIHPGDGAVVFCLKEAIEKIEHLFTHKKLL